MTNHPNRSKQQQPTHTPGPWISENQVVIKVDVNVIATIAVVDVSTNGIPIIFGNEERQANARLIAVAPELLAALNGLLNCFNSSGEIEETAEDQLSVALENAEKAQAKAEGR